MAVRQVIVSDISGKDIPEDKHARITIEGHPAVSGTVELDVLTDEAGKLQGSKLELVTVTVHEPNVPVRKVVLDVAAFNAVFKNVDITDVLGKARKADRGTPAPKRGRGTSSKTERVDYTAPDRFGQLHRGRVTEQEAALVRENPEQASMNRQAQTGQPIDFDDAKEKARYGL